MSTVEEIQARLDSITPGVWGVLRMSEADADPLVYSVYAEKYRGVPNIVLLHIETMLDPADSNASNDANARFVASAPDDIRFLLTEVKRLKAIRGE